MSYYTKAEKEAYKAGCRRIEKEKQCVIDTLMTRVVELETLAEMRGDALVSSRQINEQLNEERNACMLKMDEMRFEIVTSRHQYDALSEANKEMQNRHWEAVKKMTDEHNSERNRWQSLVDDLNRKLAKLEQLQASTAQINVSLIEERDELAKRNGKLLASGFDPYKRGHDTAKAKGDKRATELLEANSKLVERLQASENERRRIERILNAFDPATVHGGDTVIPVYVGHSGNEWPRALDLRDEIDMTGNHEDEKRAVDKKWATYGLGGDKNADKNAIFVQQYDRGYRPFNGDKNNPAFKAGYDAGLHDSKLERQTMYEDGKRDGIQQQMGKLRTDADSYNIGYKDGYAVGVNKGRNELKNELRGLINA